MLLEQEPAKYALEIERTNVANFFDRLTYHSNPTESGDSFANSAQVVKVQWSSIFFAEALNQYDAFR